MKRRVIFFAVTIVISMLIVMLFNAALRTKQATIEALRSVQTEIVVAARALAPGSTLDSANIRLATWPRASLPPGAFSNPQEVAGRVVRQSLVENQPIVPALLVDNGKNGGVLPLLIPTGMRAMSIPVTLVSDMAGMILPHCRIDVLVTTSAGEGAASNERTRIVLQNIEVLAVQSTLETTSNEPQRAEVVTLLVSPAEAERLAAAIRLGTLQLAMRNYADRQAIHTGGVDAGQLMGLPAAPTARQEPPSPAVVRRAAQPSPFRVIEVLRNGKERQTVSFNNGRPLLVNPAGSKLARESDPPKASASPSTSDPR